MLQHQNDKHSETRQWVKAHYAHDAERYDRIRVENPRGAVLTLHDTDIFKRLLTHLPRQGVTLEIGAGTGRFTIPALDYFSKVIASDVNEGMLERLRQRISESDKVASCELRIEDVFALSFEDETIDAIYSIHVIPRLLSFDDQQAALASIARVLKPGGRLLFNFRNRTSVYGLLNCGHGVAYRSMLAYLATLELDVVAVVGKHMLARKVVDILPLAIGRAVSSLDRVLEILGARYAWDVFIVTEKRSP